MFGLVPFTCNLYTSSNPRFHSHSRIRHVLTHNSNNNDRNVCNTCKYKWASVKLAWASIEASDQPAHPRIINRVFDERPMGSQGYNILQAGNQDSDQTVWNSRLIWIFAVLTRMIDKFENFLNYVNTVRGTYVVKMFPIDISACCQSFINLRA